MPFSAAHPWRTATGAVVLLVRLTPKGGRDAIEGIIRTPAGPAVKARVRAAPENGAANAALEALVADVLGLAKRDVELTSGHKSRTKSILIRGDPAALEALLKQRLAAYSTANTWDPNTIMARIIDGKAIAEQLRADVGRTVKALKASHGFTPGLSVVLVGEDAASQVYVRNKAKQTAEAGMASFEHRLPATASQAELLSIVDRLNRDPNVDGILVQLPLPRHIDTRTVIEAIDPAKDVDGFHPMNAGRLAIGEQTLVPCTPAGCVILAKSAAPRLDGMEAVIVGRSNIVGKPMMQLLLAENCTVTVAHSRTRDLAAVVARADLLIAAIGKPEMIEGAWIKPGAIVIDVGINRIGSATGKSRLVGDVQYAAAAERASAITPVPGGVGPMTIACLLNNTLMAACSRRGIPIPPA